MKKQVSFICVLSILLSTIMVPLLTLADNGSSGNSVPCNVETNLIPCDKYNYTECTDDNGVYYEKAEGNDHALVFDYQIESGYDYYLIYDYKGPATGNYGGWLQGIAATVFPNKKATGNTGYNVNAIQLNEPKSPDSWSAGNIEILNGDKLLGSKEGGTYLAITSSYVDNHAFRNLKIVKKKADNTIIPSAFTSMKLGCENGELYWQSTTTDQYSFTGFATNYELKTNQKYMVTFDVKKPDGAFKYAGFYASADYSKCDVWMDLSESQLPYASFTDFGSGEWTSKTYILDTAAVGNLVTDTNKYFSFGASIDWTNGTTLAFKNLTVHELGADEIIPVGFSGMSIKTDGEEIYWQTSNTDQFIGFNTGYELKKDTKYLITFDSKAPVSPMRYSGFFASANPVTADIWGDLVQSDYPISYFRGFDSEWTTEYFVLDSSYVCAKDEQKYLSFAMYIPGDDQSRNIQFKNLIVQEIGSAAKKNNPLVLNNINGFETVIENGEQILRYNRTSGTDEYSTFGLQTYFKAETGKKYVVDFDFKNTSTAGLCEGFTLTTYSSAYDSAASNTKVKFGDETTGDGWTDKTVIFSTEDTEKTYLGFTAKTWPNVTYDISVKNLKVFDLGDVNFDGSIDSGDLICLRKVLLGLENTGARFTNVNADDAGETDIRDLVALKKIMALDLTNS